MALELRGDGDVWKLEQRDRGPATLILKVAPTKDKAGNWNKTFLRLTVWPDRDGETTAATALHLQERDKVMFTAKARTGTWEKDGKPQSALEWTLTSVYLAGDKAPPQKQQPDDDLPPF